MLWRVVVFCGALLTGCAGSRWARDDVDYGAQVRGPYGQPRSNGQTSHGWRHAVGKRGYYAGFAGREDPFGAGAEAGVFAYPRSWMETRVGAALLAHEGERPLSGGALVGVRVQPPSLWRPL